MKGPDEGPEGTGGRGDGEGFLKGRILYRNDRTYRQGSYVLYWMQASHRVVDNPALWYAVHQANRLNLPLVCCFVFTPEYPGASVRNCHFLLEGLFEVRQKCQEMGIGFRLMSGDPPSVVATLSKNAALLVMDEGYLRPQQEWYSRTGGMVRCACVSIEANVMVPVRALSGKQEYSAATIRPKIFRQLPFFSDPIPTIRPRRKAPVGTDDDMPGETPGEFLNVFPSIGGPFRSPYFKGGTNEALTRFQRFVSDHLDAYPEERNDPTKDGLSCMSPYLHFGQISPGFLTREAIAAASPGTEPFIEELVVRRELAMNYAYYNPLYDQYEGIPAWAGRTLESHTKDKRPFLYSYSELDQAKTHDPYWNAAQEEMRVTGKMHGYMRMYWGKKIIEWSTDPKTAFSVAKSLNDRYEIDGRDPCGYTGVAWCFGTHDRPWRERAIFGTVRYMNDAGLKRKFAADGYVEKVRKLLKIGS